MESPFDKFVGPPKILHLGEVSLRDYVPIEHTADERFLEEGGDDPAVVAGAGAGDDVPYDKIPRVFTGLDDWVHNTNLRCWQCDSTFDDRPKFIPTYVREAEAGGIEVGVLGNLCTFNCAELWIRTNYADKPDLLWRTQTSLCYVYYLFTGRRADRIRPALPKTRLRRYGGDLDEDAFWREMRALDAASGLRDHTPGTVVPERMRPVGDAVPVADRARTVLITPSRPLFVIAAEKLAAQARAAAAAEPFGGSEPLDGSESPSAAEPPKAAELLGNVSCADAAAQPSGAAVAMTSIDVLLDEYLGEFL